jgi:hypothetical protein
MLDGSLQCLNGFGFPCFIHMLEGGRGRIGYLHEPELLVQPYGSTR